ncbi:MAG: hypothetical protein QNK23_18065 [Crocinitomicaceae bacterium]|nr:hypothetical protein [Crocinitomicaceae bacterium]
MLRKIIAIASFIVIIVPRTYSQNSRVYTKELNAQLDSIYAMAAYTFDPTLLVTTANKLQHYKKKEVLAMIRETYDSESGLSLGYGLFLLLRMQFDIPDDMQHLEIWFGKPGTAPPNSTSPTNRFPIIMVEDFPVILITGYMLGGLPENIDRHMEFYKKYGVLRDKPFPTEIRSSRANYYLSFTKEWFKLYKTTEIPASVSWWVEEQLDQLNLD